MKLRRFLLRYYPPGIILGYQHSNGLEGSKTIDLLDISEQYVPEILSSYSTLSVTCTILSFNAAPMSMLLWNK